jgi:hypothetical protein
MKRKVIAFCGFAQSGKGYSCKRLMTTMGFVKTSFAHTLRDVAFKVIGMPYKEGQEYEELKKTKLFNDLTFRNILENLGSAIREYDEDFWAKGVIKFIESTPKNVCIDDLRYPNEYRVLKKYCEANDIDLKLIFCDYHSKDYDDSNPHESAQMAKYLKEKGYKDQEYVDEIDIANYELIKIREQSEGWVDDLDLTN